MKKIANYIFNISSKKLSIYLILGPLLLFLAHTITTIAFKTISGTSDANQSLLHLVIGVLSTLLAGLIMLWFSWLHGTVRSVEKKHLGLNLRWFQIAFILLIIYILYSICYPFVEHTSEDFQSIFYPFSEFISFGGILIAYPLICHYVGRAIVVKKTKQQATFIGALPYTLLLFFGTVLVIPFLHNYFSTKTSNTSEIVTIYGISFGLLIAILILGFIAAITGLV